MTDVARSVVIIYRIPVMLWCILVAKFIVFWECKESNNTRHIKIKKEL